MNAITTKIFAASLAVAIGVGSYFLGAESGTTPIATAPAASAPAVSTPAATAAAAGARVNLNTATEAELDALPGIGEKTVAQTLAARPIASVDQVAALPGVRPSNLAKFRDLVTV
jgi:competence protein ComEA